MLRLTKCKRIPLACVPLLLLLEPAVAFVEIASRVER